MSINLGNIEISAKIPEVKKEMSVFLVKSPPFEERKRSVDFFRKYMHLGDMVSIDAEDSLLMVGKQAEIQYYRPSGALWINNFSLDENYKDERRNWRVEETRDPDDQENSKFNLIPEVEKMLLNQTRNIFEESGMLAKEAYFAEIDLDQVVQLDEKGNERARFPGEANVKFLYKLEGIRVEGPGAKLYAFFNPGKREHELSGIYHAWRDVFDARKIKIPSVEESLERMLTQDEEMTLLKKNNSIEILDIDLTYFSMVPSAYQRYIFPVYHITGSVVPEDEEKKNEGFGFSRFFNAAAPVSYAKADCYADYLACRYL